MDGETGVDRRQQWGGKAPGQKQTKWQKCGAGSKCGMICWVTQKTHCRRKPLGRSVAPFWKGKLSNKSSYEEMK